MASSRNVVRGLALDGAVDDPLRGTSYVPSRLPQAFVPKPALRRKVDRSMGQDYLVIVGNGAAIVAAPSMYHLLPD